MKKLLFITDNPLDQTLAYDYSLPALAESGWEVTAAGVGASKGVRLGALPYRCWTIDLPKYAAVNRLNREWTLGRTLMAAGRKAPVVYVHSQTMGLRAASITPAG